MIENINNLNSGGTKVKQGSFCVIRDISKDLFYVTQEKKSARWKNEGHIGIVGGRQEPGENILDTIKREGKEEGGLINIDENDLKNIGNLTLNDINNLHPQIDVAIFALEVSNIMPVEDDETKGLLYTKKQIGELIKLNPIAFRPLVLEALYYYIPGAASHIKSVTVSNGNYNSIDSKLIMQILQYYK